MKHTKECRICKEHKPDTEEYFYWRSDTKSFRTDCSDCERKRNKKRMYVNGKHVSVKHPLYKEGNYKTFEGAAFASLEGYEKSTEGHVYIISNPCWDGWLKVGMAVDAEDRCNQYQTSSPFRDYKLCYTKYFKDRRSAEQMAHKKLKKISVKYKGEWFKVSIKEATNLIQAI